MSSRQLENFMHQGVFLTYVEIFRADHLGEYSFKEIGYRYLPSHEAYRPDHHNFNLIHIPNNYMGDKYWQISKKLLEKGKNSEEISKILSYIDEKSLVARLAL